MNKAAKAYHHPDAPAKYVIALIPLVPVLFALVALLRYLGRVDEMQRRIQLDAFAVAAGAAGLFTFAYSMLEGVGAPRVGLEWILPFIIVVWGVTGAVSTWRYNR